MHTESLILNLLDDVLTRMHSKRFEALSAVVLSALNNDNLSVTGLGRGISSNTQERYNIKRADRLLSNSHLQSERIDIYRSISNKIIGASKRPIIIIDWSYIDEPKELFLLRASTPVGGRSLTIYEEIHGLEDREKRKTHICFLDILSSILPSESKPILVTDAGFRTPWFESVQKLGWDWVGRIRNRNLVQRKGENDWKPCKDLYKVATNRTKKLGTVLLTRSNPIECKLVIYKSKPKGRVNKNDSGIRAQSGHSKKYAVRNKEPWLLATSIQDSFSLSKKTVKIYKTRMQIEEAFRDLKSARFGMSLEHSKTYKGRRLEILILVGAIASVIAWIIGKATEIAGFHRHYQANSIKNKTILSSIFIGLRVVKDKNFFKLKISKIEFEKVLKKTFYELKNIVREHDYAY